MISRRDPSRSGRGGCTHPPLCFVLLALLILAGCKPARRVDSVVLVTIDTLRADHVTCYGGAPGLTPALDSLAAEGARVERAWTTIPLTTPAHASILSGLYPPGHGVRNNARFRLPDSVTTLAEIYARNGRRTGGFVASFTTSSWFGLGQGFETFDDDMGQDDQGHRRVQRQAHEVVDRALAWLKGNDDKPFFLWVHFYDPHTPYEAPPAFARRFPGDGYSAEVAFADAQLGRLLDALKASGAAEHAVVVAMADHGEGLGTHGEPEHGLLLYEETVHVPLLIRAPGRITPGTVIKEPASTVDVAPTVLAMTGLDVPAEMQGRDLFGKSAGAPRTIYAETLYPYEEFGWSALYALRSGEKKYIESPKPELFALDADPRETKNLARPQEDDARAMALALRKRALELVHRERLSTAAGLGAEGDTETISRLESLGYVAGGGGAVPGKNDALPAVGGPNPVDMMEDYRLFERAQQLLTAGQHDAAIGIFEKLAARDPGNPQVGLKLAVTLEAAKRDADAEARYKKLIADHPTFYLAYRSYSDFLEKRDRARESRAIWLRLQSLLPGYVGIDSRLAQAEVAAGLPGEAAKRLEAFLDQRPDDADAWVQLGRARMALGRKPEALDAFRRALVRQPTNPVAVKNSVDLLVGDGKPEAARMLLDELLKRDPADPLLQRTRMSLKP